MIWKLILRQIYFTKSVDAHCASITSLLQSFKTWTLSFKVFSVKPKEWRKSLSLSLSLLWPLHGKEWKALCNRNICLRLRVDYVRFAYVRKSFRYEQNFLFGRNKPAEGRSFLKKINVMHEFLCTGNTSDYWTQFLEVKYFLLWISSILWCLNVFSLK